MSPKTSSRRHRTLRSATMAGRTTPEDKAEYPDFSTPSLDEDLISSQFALPCRMTEFQIVRNFLLSNLTVPKSGSMYISGLPGTGKSAVVQRVIESLQQSKSSPKFTFIEVNGMKLSDPHRVFHEILSALKLSKPEAQISAVQRLERFFSASDNRKIPTVILIDELDLLWTRKQDILYQLFEWPSSLDSRLTVLAIANTLDLPERMMTARVASRLGMVRLSFQPYTYQQLGEIIRFRLSSADHFDAEAIEFVSRKVAAVSGDIRRAVDICYRAAEIRRTGTEKLDRRFSTASANVTLTDVGVAVKEMFAGLKLATLSAVSLHEGLLLRSLLAEVYRTGLEDLNVSQVDRQYRILCRLEGAVPAHQDQLAAVYQSLSSCQLISSDCSQPFSSKRVRLNVSSDDVSLALRLSKEEQL